MIKVCILDLCESCRINQGVKGLNNKRPSLSWIFDMSAAGLEHEVFAEPCNFTRKGDSIIINSCYG